MRNTKTITCVDKIKGGAFRTFIILYNENFLNFINFIESSLVIFLQASTK